MVVSEGAINNIMGGMENTAGVRLHSHRHKLKQRFDIIRKLGQGTYGKVQLAVNKETGQEVAIKTIKKAKIETEQDLIRIRREIQIMSSVQHPQIIHIYEVFENREKMVLVMEYAAGGELYDYLSERKVLSEDEARRVFRHVASATYYCHKHKICHRDLKLENILLDLDGNAKIADFGLSNVFDEKHRLDTFCGSPLYASPEIVKGIPYTGPEVDCWSLGVLLYTLVYGAMPFDGSNFKRLVKQITQGDYYEPKKPSSASELIRAMLTVSASKRANIEDICSHWWVNEGYLESCLDVAEALANQTPVRLDLLLSLAPKHINSEHMLIQPEEEDSARSPPTSEATRPPPQLQLPPPPPDPTPTGAARSSSLGAITSANVRNDIEALVVKKLQEKKEEERKRKADETGTIDKKKKKDSIVEGTPKSSRKERRSDVVSDEVGSVRRPPAGPDGDSSERKKSVKKRDPLVDGDTSERSERSERKKSVKKREPVIDGDASDMSEKSERRKSVKKREPSAEKDISESEKVERKKSVKKREPSLTRESNEDKEKRKSSTKKKESQKEKTPSKTGNEAITEPSAVINGEKHKAGKAKDMPLDPLEDQSASLSLKPSVPKDQVIEKDKSPSKDWELSKNGSMNGKEPVKPVVEQEPMEVEAVSPDVPTISVPSLTKSSGSAKSVGSAGSNDGTLKASNSSLSRDSVSPMKCEAALTPTSQEPTKKSKSPSPGQTPKVSDARKAFEQKPADKSTVVLRKKPTTESLPSSPTQKDTPELSTTNSVPAVTQDVKEDVLTSEITTSEKKEKSPAKEKTVAESAGKEKTPRKVIESEAKAKSPKPPAAEADIVQTKEVTKIQTKEVTKIPVAEKKEAEKPIEIEKEEKADVVKKPTPTDKLRAGADEKMVTPKTPTHTVEVSPRETVTSSEEEEAVVVGGLHLKLGGVGKISEVGTQQEVRKADSSESSDSESEAEKLLKLLSEKREKVEASRREKLRKMSEAKERDLKKDMPAIKEEPQSKSPSKSPPKSPEMASKPLAPEPKETPPEPKFATLPRGFKTKPSGAGPGLAVAKESPRAQAPDKLTRDNAINQEIEGMMTAIKAVDRAITQGTPGRAIGRDKPQEPDNKKSEAEIVLNKKKAEVDPINKRSSYAQIHLSSPTAKEAPKQEFKTEVRHNVMPSRVSGDSQLQRAKRERIIPIMLEDDDDDDDRTTSESLSRNERLGGSSSTVGSRVTSPQPPQAPLPTSTTDTRPPYSASPDSLRKSRRERIIPIAVEGEGIVTPPAHIEEAAELGAARAHQAFSRTMAGRPNTLNRGRGFMLDHSESFSSAGEEEEEDEDDGFQILTAESLFSTLLNRVRSLTRKMNVDDIRSDRSRRFSNQATPEPGSAPGSAGIGAAHSNSSGFWSSLYNSPRDSPARRISETMSRSSLGRDDETFGGLSSPLWTRGVSRDTSDADTLFSEASTPFGTLPRVRTLRHSLHLPPPRLLQDPFFLSDLT